MQRSYRHLLQYFLLFYAALTFYASWYPFNSWNWNGLMPWAFWGDASYRYISRVDIWLNVLAYMPLGTLFIWRWYNRTDHLMVILWATLLASGLSFFVECMQTYIPQRVPSKLDWYANTLGGFLGAVMGVVFSPHCLKQTSLVQIYKRAFTHQYLLGLLLWFLWLSSVLAPQPYWFGLGYLLDHLPPLQNADAGFSWLPSGLLSGFLWCLYRILSGSGQWLLGVVYPHLSAESALRNLMIFVMVSFLSGMSLAITLHLKQYAKKIWVILPAVSFVAFNMLYFLLMYDDKTIPSDVYQACVISFIFLYIMAYCSALWRALVAIILLFMGGAVLHVMPMNAYYEHTTAMWQTARYAHMFGMFSWVGVVLPWLAMAWCLYLCLAFRKMYRQMQNALLRKYGKNSYKKRG